MPDPAIREHPLPYADRLAERDQATIELVVIHCTELPDLATARQYGEKIRYANGTGNSGHYYLDRDGSIHAWVPLERTANHVRRHNPASIGIELINRGRYPDWYAVASQSAGEVYPEAQVVALATLLDFLSGTLPNLRYIAGHEELDTELQAASDDPTAQVRRKVDPGPMFPWSRVLAATRLKRLPPNQQS